MSDIQFTNTVRGLEALGQRLDDAARIFVVESTNQVARQAQINANTGTHPKGKGHNPGSGPGPNVVSGTLRRSIRPDPVRRTLMGWAGTAGPHTIYARAVELGLSAWNGLRYPYLGPAITQWKRSSRALLASIVNREVHRV